MTKARSEISEVLKLENDMTTQKWKEVLNFENLNELKYIHECILETLRIEPSVASSSGLQLTEKV